MGHLAGLADDVAGVEGDGGLGPHEADLKGPVFIAGGVLLPERPEGAEALQRVFDGVVLAGVEFFDEFFDGEWERVMGEIDQSVLTGAGGAGVPEDAPGAADVEPEGDRQF